MHSLSKIPRKFSVIKKKSIFQPVIFFPQVSFSGASVRNREHINRPNRGHPPVESLAVWRASPDNTVRPDQSNCSSPNGQPPTSQPDVLSACLFYLFNKKNKLNLLVRSYFSCNHTLYITFVLVVSILFPWWVLVGLPFMEFGSSISILSQGLNLFLVSIWFEVERSMDWLE